MNTEATMKSLHDGQKPQTNKPKMTLSVLLPEINQNQWMMFSYVLTDHLKLTKRQQAALNVLIGEQ